MISIAIVCAAASLLLTALVRHFALRRDLYDHPNHRSLHDSPMPRGGGLGIVLTVQAYVLYALFTGTIDRPLGVALIGGGTLIAAVGALDDVRSLSAQTRLAVHFVAAIWAVYWLGGLPFLETGIRTIHLGFVGALASVVLVVWTTNLYNFMDGIDGLAGLEAASLGAFGGALLLMASNATSLATLSFVLLGAAVGFLCWNWAPARIFMGDAGSGFLGFTFGTLAVWTENSRTLPIMVWFILASAFFLDASITIVRRMRYGMWRYAHRTHAYQRAVRSGLSHSTVALIVGGFNLLMAALAAIAVARPSFLLPAAVAAIILGSMLYLVVGRLEPFVVEPPPL